MLLFTAKSVNGYTIRLTSERWCHIVENHDELAGNVFEILTTVEKPDFIVDGKFDEKLGARKIDGKYIIVVYKEEGKNDGFIITSFLTTKIRQIIKKGIIWGKQS